MENQQQTIEGQIQAAKTAEEEKRKSLLEEIEAKDRLTKSTGLAQNQTAVVNMVASFYKPSGETGAVASIPLELKPLVNAVIQNIMVGAIAQTEEQKQQIIEQMQQAQAMQEQQMMEQQQMQQQEQSQQPQQPMAAA
jgi:hypothetical protein